ncbi:MFS transporter [Streptomyces sp. NPDC090306]|uniref:MFS transporter n=1 Tax=Streptomyces sp. NPDC090306 TaxID=3365961 RepID=UPI003805A33C
MKLKQAWRSGPLGTSSFRLLTAGQFVSTAGDYCYAVALPWLVLSNHGSTVLLGMLLACYGVPRTVFIPVGGMLADKIGPRATMLIADASRFVFVALFAVLAAGHHVSIVALGPLAALIGAGEGLFIPASYAIVPSLLDKGTLMSGNAVFSAGQQVGALIGPAMGGVLVAGLGPAPALAVDAASFGVSTLCIAFIRARAVGASSDEEAAQAVIDVDPIRPADPSPETSGGVLRLLRKSRQLRVHLMVVLAVNLSLAGLGEVALPALVHDRWAASSYGTVLACSAIGAILGSVGASRAGGLRRPMTISGLTIFVMSVAIVLLPFLGGIAGAAAAMLVMGLCASFGSTIAMPAVQTYVPPRLLGRTMSAIMLCSLGSMPLSVAVTGVLVQHIGPAAFFPIAGALVGVVVLLGLTQRTWREFGARDVPVTAESPTNESALSA